MVELVAKIVTVSDGVAAGTREDVSGPALAELLIAKGWRIVSQTQISDGQKSVSECLVKEAQEFAGLIVTTGGTGFGPRDLTPEGTLAIIDRQAQGLAEAMRAASPRGLGRLSRAVAGTIDQCIVINTPGSPKGAAETLNAVIDVLPHALELCAGETPH